VRCRSDPVKTELRMVQSGRRMCDADTYKSSLQKPSGISGRRQGGLHAQP
jgi:hypothetical protein